MPNSYFYANDLSNFFTVYLNQAHLVNYVEILLHDHFSGCIEIANPSGVIVFIPWGFAPRDEKMTPLGLAISMHPSK